MVVASVAMTLPPTIARRGVWMGALVLLGSSACDAPEPAAASATSTRDLPADLPTLVAAAFCEANAGCCVQTAEECRDQVAKRVPEMVGAGWYHPARLGPCLAAIRALARPDCRDDRVGDALAADLRAANAACSVVFSGNVAAGELCPQGGCDEVGAPFPGVTLCDKPRFDVSEPDRCLSAPALAKPGEPCRDPRAAGGADAFSALCEDGTCPASHICPPLPAVEPQGLGGPCSDHDGCLPELACANHFAASEATRFTCVQGAPFAASCQGGTCDRGLFCLGPWYQCALAPTVPRAVRLGKSVLDARCEPVRPQGF